jgi:hypothetical protein
MIFKPPFSFDSLTAWSNNSSFCSDSIEGINADDLNMSLVKKFYDCYNLSLSDMQVQKDSYIYFTCVFRPVFKFVCKIMAKTDSSNETSEVQNLFWLQFQCTYSRYKLQNLLWFGS